jgi:hypothetical protein
LGAIAQPGRLLLGISRLGERPGVTGAGTAAVITFTTKKPGDSQVRLERPKAMGPALENLLPVTAQNAKVRVVPAESEERISSSEGPHA